jgi:thiol-disulfide isomerase/thioredoxin
LRTIKQHHQTAMQKKFIFTALSLLSLTAAYAQQYEIRVKMEGVRDSDIFLGYSYEDKRYVVDTATPDKNGNAVFSKNKKLERGVYFITTPERSYFELLIGDNQKFSVSTDRKNLFDKLEFKGSPENQQFLDYQKYLRDMQREANAVRQRQKSNEEGKKDSTAIYQKQLEAIDSTVNAYIKNLIARNENNFLGTLLKALQPAEIPEFDIPESVVNKDSVRQVRDYEYRRAHYLDVFNFSDNGLIRTPFFKSRLDYFFQKMIVLSSDTIIKYADMVIERSRTNNEMFHYVTEYFFQYYQKSEIVGHDAIIVHLADKYYLSGLAHWANDEYKGKIKERVDKIRPNLIGAIAPELLLQTHENTYVSLRKTPADFTVLAFWEPSCGHCKKEIPQLWELYQKLRDRGVVVFAVYTQYKRAEWDTYLEEHPYDWGNAWDGIEGNDEQGKPTTFSLGTEFRSLYDVYSTPTLYLLDKNKKILAKRISVETLEKILEEEMKRGQR